MKRHFISEWLLFRENRSVSAVNTGKSALSGKACEETGVEQRRYFQRQHVWLSSGGFPEQCVAEEVTASETDMVLCRRIIL